MRCLCCLGLFPVSWKATEAAGRCACSWRFLLPARHLLCESCCSGGVEFFVILARCPSARLRPGCVRPGPRQGGFRPGQRPTSLMAAACLRRPAVRPRPLLDALRGAGAVVFLRMLGRPAGTAHDRFCPWGVRRLRWLTLAAGDVLFRCVFDSSRSARTCQRSNQTCRPVVQRQESADKPAHAIVASRTRTTVSRCSWFGSPVPFSTLLTVVRPSVFALVGDRAQRRPSASGSAASSSAG